MLSIHEVLPLHQVLWRNFRLDPTVNILWASILSHVHELDDVVDFFLFFQ